MVDIVAIQGRKLMVELAEEIVEDVPNRISTIFVTITTSPNVGELDGHGQQAR
jgi:hypothetical protein